MIMKMPKTFSEGSVGYGLGLYMMGMTRVLILIENFSLTLILLQAITLPNRNTDIDSDLDFSLGNFECPIVKNIKSSSNNRIIAFLGERLSLIILGITIASLMYGIQESEDG